MKIPQEKGCYVYLLRCEDHSLYCGWTTHLINRFKMHQSGKGAKYTKAHKPIEIFYYESFPDEISARKREYEIKQMTHEQKMKLKEYHYLFTYGTLMKGESNHFYLKGSKYIGDGIIRGYRLLEIEDYPGAVPTDDLQKEVVGEVYKISHDTKKEIDILEEGYLYKNIIVDIEGKKLVCGFYEFIDDGNEYLESKIKGKWTLNT